MGFRCRCNPQHPKPLSSVVPSGQGGVRFGSLADATYEGIGVNAGGDVVRLEMDPGKGGRPDVGRGRRRWVLWLLDEVEPWLKWTLYDAIVALLVAQLVKRFGGKAETVLGLIGWL